ncbi:hypothetical protein FRACYDRAFT_245030 [Fragilariopsis cylindrus CCMP1102]|uniref:O-fucosyltransferase family protein n=1 Tax=Fragilariopsis cylindrus CCMP1102 TaxID=635003 RepID=A0A1E7F1A8_9STRA|nr:hypothetical protein FRACYDRAFT_245030 [Fragilariopsis cylindrus CCMP1102]|eukprot:OEU11907.1 hypothetical protein FRACYDRAFT_245030 [Fragilariopsis cylindrus CCMP1102]
MKATKTNTNTNMMKATNTTKSMKSRLRTTSKIKKIKNVVLFFLLLFVANTMYLWYSLSSLVSDNNNNNEGINNVHGVPNPITHQNDNSKLHHDWKKKDESNNNDEEEEEKKQDKNGKNGINVNNQTYKSNKKTRPPTPSSLLNCDAYGGPYKYDVISLNEMVYWKEIPNDWNYHQFTSNSNKEDSKESKEHNPDKYLTFDTDLSGFNNQRMVFEINIAMAISTNRILVIPNKRYIDHFPDKLKLNSMIDFFNLTEISFRSKNGKNGFQFISMNEYIKREGQELNIPTDFTNWTTTTTPSAMSVVAAAAGENNNTYSNQFLLNQSELRCNPLSKNVNCSDYTNWINEKHVVQGQWKYYVDEYFHDHPKMFCPSSWGASMCLIVIPDNNTGINSSSSDNTNDNTSRYKAWMEEIKKEQQQQQQLHNQDLHDKYVGHPISVNATPTERIKEIYGPQRQIGFCIYNHAMSKQKYYHMRDDPIIEQRILANWYDYIFYENYHQDLWMKRFMRDSLRYNNEIQCCAARIIKSIRTISRENNENGIYHSMHIRRTDMIVAYKQYNIDRNSNDIYTEFINEIPNNSIVYISTDEKDI